MFCQQDGKVGVDFDLFFFYLQFIVDDLFLFYVMYIELFFGFYCIKFIFCEVNVFDDFIGESGIGVVFVFYVIFIEVYVLQWVVKFFEGRYRY